MIRIQVITWRSWMGMGKNEQIDLFWLMAGGEKFLLLMALPDR